MTSDEQMSFLSEQIAARLDLSLAQRLNPYARPFGVGAQNVRANQYGGKAVLKFNPSTDEINSGIRQQATIVDWSSPDGQAYPLTVEVGRIAVSGGGSFPTPSGVATSTNLSYRANCMVVYSTPGATQDPFFIDINRGQRFTVTSSYVNVTAQMAPPPAGYLSGSLAVFGNIGVGTSISTAPVFFTQYIDGAATPTNLIIPPKANLIWPVRSVGGSGTIILNFFDNSGTLVDQLIFATGTMVFPLQIPQDAYLVNFSAGAGAVSRLVYQLSV